MTTLLNTYSFMDLLKDYNYVPETDQNSNPILQDIEGAFDAIADLVKSNGTDYDFMDLLNDHGYVPVNGFKIPGASNDNGIFIQVA